jgi:hypothetical protein
MLVAAWVFIGFLLGMLIVAVFQPPLRKQLRLPTPNSKEVLHTGVGCVKFKTTEVECTPAASSLNFIATLNK